jgi:hypothetical protein
MDTTEERRSGGRRVPLQLGVELTHAGYVEGFDADAFDMSAGGMAMKAGCLPDVGSRLACKFAPPSGQGAAATATGEVVWARLDDQHTGTFGVRFVDLDAGAARLIARVLNEKKVSPAPRVIALPAGPIESAQSAEPAHAAEPMQTPGPAHAAESTHAADPAPTAEPAHKPTALGLGSDENASAASLEIEGLPELVPASVDDARGFATFEQPLDVFRLGRIVRRRTGRVERAGSIAKVELRVLGNTPLLAVTVDFAQDRPFEELELELEADARRHREALGLADDESFRPDAFGAGGPDEGPSEAVAADASGAVETVLRTSRVTETEFSVPPEMAEAPETGASQLDLALGASDEVLATSDAPDVTASSLVSNDTMEVWPPAIARRETGASSEAPDAETGAELLSDAPRGSDAPGADAIDQLDAPFAAARPATAVREPSVTFALLRDAAASAATAAPTVRAPRLNEELDAEIEAMALLRARRWPPKLPDGVADHAARALQMARRLWVLGRAAIVAAGAMLWPWLSAKVDRALPPLRGGLYRARTLASALYTRHVKARARATRRLLVVTWRRRRRRKTMAAPQAAAGVVVGASEDDAIAQQPAQGPRRWVVGAIVGAVAAGGGAYALAPAFSGPAKAPAVSSAAASPGARAKVTKSNAVRKAASRASATASHKATSATATAVPGAASVAGASSAVAAATPVAPTKPVVFGAAKVRSAQRFVLRMTSPVAELRGVADAGGFTVVIPGSLALDPAGPIKKQHAGVEKAMILNKGSESQLTVRFADGKKPAYQVRGDGARIEILLEGA